MPGGGITPTWCQEGPFPTKGHWSRELSRRDGAGEFPMEGVARAKGLGQKHREGNLPQEH